MSRKHTQPDALALAVMGLQCLEDLLVGSDPGCDMSECEGFTFQFDLAIRHLHIKSVAFYDAS